MEENKQPLLDRFLAPDREQQKKNRDFIKQTAYYGLIGLISILGLCVVPFFAGGVQGDFSLYFPSSVQGWIVYWLIRGGSAAMNVCIFALFKMQAKVNIKSDPEYIKAREILHKVSSNGVKKPRSPAQMEAQEWSTKGATIFISSLVAGCTLSALVLSFDMVTFLSCITTIIMGLCFGYVTMRKNEIYWTEEYPEYAEYIRVEAEKEEHHGNSN